MRNPINETEDVFAIILDNAIQYNKEGGKIDITTEQGNDILLVKVVNTGIGLNENDKANPAPLSLLFIISLTKSIPI